MKKIIFFDADGTLWYPSETKYTKHPVWVYRKYSNPHEARRQMVLIPGVIQTLRILKKKGVKLIVLSTNPREPNEANAIMQDSVKHFKIKDFFDEVHATREYLESKGEFILKIINKYGFTKKEALMVGDSYEWDYNSARSVGVDALLIEHNYEKAHPNTNKVKRRINKLSDVLKFI
ncbi:MAG: HAD hydrolase-like protein [Nanoarchaeota archaeon]